MRIKEKAKTPKEKNAKRQQKKRQIWCQLTHLFTTLSRNNNYKQLALNQKKNSDWMQNPMYQKCKNFYFSY